MKIRDISKSDDKFLDFLESATGGSTSAGSIASIANPMETINRRPSLFGYIPAAEPESKKKSRKSTRKRG